MTAARIPDDTLDAVLAPCHDAWVMEARRELLPVMEPGRGTWERWPAVRWLNDRFPEHFLAEQALVNELRPLLTVHEEEMLDAGEDRIARLRLALDRVARRHGSAEEFATMAREFVLALEMWCGENELAARRVRRRSLPADARRAVEKVESVSGAPLLI